MRWSWISPKNIVPSMSTLHRPVFDSSGSAIAIGKEAVPICYAWLILPKESEQFKMAEEAVKITVRPNGPLRVEGPISLTDADGRHWDLTGKPAISLCRCGASEKRPFCDGSHNRIGFQCSASPALLT